MEGSTARMWSSDKGRCELSTGEREAKRDVSCMVVSPDKEKEVCCSHRTGFLDSEPAFRLSGVVGAKNQVGLVAPSFLSSSPAKTGRVPKGRQGRSAGLVRPAAAGEDTAPHALTARRHARRSREWRDRKRVGWGQRVTIRVDP